MEHMKHSMKFMAIGAGGLLLVLLVLWAATGFNTLGIHGAILGAMIFGIVLTAGLGLGLMALVFHSGRGDYDDAAYRYDISVDKEP